MNTRRTSAVRARQVRALMACMHQRREAAASERTALELLRCDILIR